MKTCDTRIVRCFIGALMSGTLDIAITLEFLKLRRTNPDFNFDYGKKLMKCYTYNCTYIKTRYLQIICCIDSVN